MAKARRNARTGQPASEPAVPAQAQETEEAARAAADQARDAGGAGGAGGGDLSDGWANDLTRINGVTPRLVGKLMLIGIDTIADLASMDPHKLSHDLDGAGVDEIFELDLAGWISQAAAMLQENTEEKPPRSDDEHVARSRDEAGLPADGGAGDPQTNNPEGSSGTAREAPSTDGGTTAATPDVGAQPGSRLHPSAHQHWPFLAAALDAWQAAHGAGGGEPMVRITARFDDGFRRCGRHHPSRATDHPFGRWTLDELELLFAEPALKVELV